MPERVTFIDYTETSDFDGWEVEIELDETFGISDLIDGPLAGYFAAQHGDTGHLYSVPGFYFHEQTAGAMLLPIPLEMLDEDSVGAAQLEAFEALGHIVARLPGSPQFTTEMLTSGRAWQLSGAPGFGPVPSEHVAALAALPSLDELRFEITAEEVEALSGYDDGMGSLRIDPLVGWLFGAASQSYSYATDSFTRSVGMSTHVGLDAYWTNDTRPTGGTNPDGTPEIWNTTPLAEHFAVRVDIPALLGVEGPLAGLDLIEGERGPKFTFTLDAPLEETVKITARLEGSDFVNDLEFDALRIKAGETTVSGRLVKSLDDPDDLISVETGNLVIEARAGGEAVLLGPASGLALSTAAATLDVDLRLTDRILADLENSALKQTGETVVKTLDLMKVLFDTLIRLDDAIVPDNLGKIVGKAFKALALPVQTAAAVERYGTLYAEAQGKEGEARYRAEFAALEIAFGDLVDAGLEAIASTAGGAGLAAAAMWAGGAAATAIGVTATAPVWLPSLLAAGAATGIALTYDQLIGDAVKDRARDLFRDAFDRGDRYIEIRAEFDATYGPDAAPGPFDLHLGDRGADDLDGTVGRDFAKLRAGDDRFDGGRGADHLLGQAGADDLRGGRGNDRLDGGRGADALSGGGGADLLLGGGGRDVLDGGRGGDRMEGGRGADTFVFRAGHDVIVDYTARDVVELARDEVGDARIEMGDGSLTLHFSKGRSLTFEGITDVSDIVFA